MIPQKRIDDICKKIHDRHGWFFSTNHPSFNGKIGFPEKTVISKNHIFFMDFFHLTEEIPYEKSNMFKYLEKIHPHSIIVVHLNSQHVRGRIGDKEFKSSAELVRLIEETLDSKSNSVCYSKNFRPDYKGGGKVGKKRIK